MKQKWLLIASLAALALALPASSATAAPRGSFHRGFHGGHTRIFIGGYFGPYWGWGWPYYGYYGYPYDGYRYASANWGAVKTDVDPEDARVYLDGKYIGTADDFDGWPDKLYLRPGRYKLEFRLSGYETLSLDVRARVGTTLEVDNKLRKAAPGVTQAPDPPKMEGDVPRFFGKRRDGDRARPYVQDRDRDDDDASMGTRDDDERAPAPDVRDRDADRDRGRSSRDDDSWRNSRRPDSTVTGRPVRADRARLAIHAEPADAAVYVDDRFVGTADELASMERGIVVTPGKHTVTVSRPGYRDRSTEIEVESGHTETVKLSLAK